MSVLETEKWQQLKPPQVQVTTGGGSPYIARVPVSLRKDRILISPSYCPHLHLFDSTLNKWQIYEWPYDNFEAHVMCLSNDKTKLIVFEGFDKILVIIDIDTMKVINKIEQLFLTGSSPSIIPDPQNNELNHIIGGSAGNMHQTINFISGEVQQMHNFPTIRKSAACGIVYIKHKNVFLMFNIIPMFSYDLNMKTWTIGYNNADKSTSFWIYNESEI